MVLAKLDSGAGRQSDLLVELDLADYRIPAQVSQGQQPRVVVAAGYSLLAVAFLGQDHSVDEDVPVFSDQVEDPGELREFVVAQEPRIAVELRRKEEVPVESLENQVILPVIEAR